MPSLDKHTLPRLARLTPNELHQNQHEKASLVCVRVQSPSGLAPIGAVCVEYGRPKWPITMLNHRHPWYKKMVLFFFVFFWHFMLVRPAMKRLYCLKAKNGLIKIFPLLCFMNLELFPASISPLYINYHRASLTTQST